MSNLPPIPPAATQDNPLSAYFRVPGLSVLLPTGGAFMPENSYSTAVDGSFPVYPMRTADEYLLKSADSLLSGHAIEKLIESCMPGIKAPSWVSMPDLDVILLAIRAATYGDKMEVNAICPICEHENVFDCHLPSVLDTMKPVPTDNPVRLSNELVAYVRPYCFRNATQIALVTFQETRKVQALELDMDATDEQRSQQLNASMARISKLQADMLAECVYKIATPNGDVSDPQYIREFVNNISAAWVVDVAKKLTELNDNYGIDKSVHAECQNKKCGHVWTTNIEFDPSSFFDTGS